MKLVDDVSDWKRWWSLRWIAISAFFSAVVVMYSTLPSDWLPTVPVEMKQWLSVGALFSAGAAGVSRVFKQGTKADV